MSVIERIRHIQQAQQQAQAEQAAREEAARYAPKDQRGRFVVQQGDKVLRESGVLKGLFEIKKSGFDYPTIERPEIKYYGYYGYKEGDFYIQTEEFYGVELSWSSGHYSIFVKVNPDTEDLTIAGATEKKLSKTQWIHKEIVEEALASAFVNPRQPSRDQEDGTH